MSTGVPCSVRRLRSSLLLAGITVLTGCSSINPTSSYEKAQFHIHRATGASETFIPSDPDKAKATASRLSRGPLTSERAVQIALLNNNQLQAMMFDIGIAHAEVVQAGLLSNPSLDALLRFPVGSSGSNLEAGLLQNLLSAFRVPARKQIAKEQLAETVKEVAYLATKVAAETRNALNAIRIAFRAESIARQNVTNARQLAHSISERMSLGLGTKLDVNAAEAEAIHQELYLQTAKRDLDTASQVLSQLLGRSEINLSIFSSVNERLESSKHFDLETMLRLAESHRLDLAARRHKLEMLETELRLEKRRFLRQASIGTSVEANNEGTEVGPAIDLEIPIFDQNQARIAQAQYRLSKHQHLYEAQRLRVRTEVHQALTRYRTARQSLKIYEDRLLPLRRSNLALAREAFTEGKVEVLFVLEAQRRLLNARIQHLPKLNEFLDSLSEVQRAVGLPHRAILEAANANENLQ